MRGRYRTAGVFGLILALAGLLLVAVPETGQAQGLFDRLFGAPRGGARLPPGEVGRPAEQPVPRRAPDPQPPLVEVKPKDADAMRLLVVGDFLAGSLAEGLDQTFAGETRIAVVARTDGSSGLVRADHYDWDAQLPAILNSEKPDYVVVLIGANDRQAFRQEGGRAAFGTPEWEAAYRARARELAETLRVYGRPAFWIGLPPMSAAEASADMVYLNGLYREAAERAGAKFIDVWDAFADEDGRYTRRGPDIDGQPRTLRAGDGINFTRSGERKLAFYVDREIRLPGNGAAETFLASEAPGNRIEVLPDGSKLLVGPVISLGDPPPGAATDLAGGDGLIDPGAPDRSAAGADSPLASLVERGKPPPPVPGRVDDFRWPAER